MKAKEPYCPQTEFMDQCNHLKHYVPFEPTIENYLLEKKVVQNFVEFMNSKSCKNKEKMLAIITYHQKRVKYMESLSK